MRAPDATAEVEAGGNHQLVDWNGGTLDDLVAILSGPAWSARVEVLPTNGGNPVGEVHVIAGGVSDAIYDGKSTHDALDKLRAAKNTRFRVEPRLPNPSDGDLTFPGPDQGKLEERPLAHLMRYCEDYVLTAGIEVWRGSENAKVDYRRGEIVGVTVGGIDAPERLAEVMKWSSGSYRLLVPRLTLPETAPKAAAPAVVVAPRTSSAANRTIFGMPALDPAALAALQAQGKSAAAIAPAAGPGRVHTPVIPPPTNRSGPIAAPPPTAVAPPPESSPQAAAKPQSSAVAKTIFGVQAPPPAAPVQGPAAATAATPPSDVAVAATATAGTAPAPAARPSAAGEPTKPARMTAPAPTQPVAARAAATPAAVAAAQRTTQNKVTVVPPVRGAETPVWTYVGVGFVFGLALLGVYRLVIVLAH